MKSLSKYNIDSYGNNNLTGRRPNKNNSNGGIRHEFQGVNPRVLDSCPGVSDTSVGSILIDSAFRLIQSDANNN